MSDQPKKPTALVGPIRPARELVRGILRSYGEAPILRFVGAKDEKGFFIFNWSGKADKEGSYLIYDSEQDIFVGILRKKDLFYAVPMPQLFVGRLFHLIRVAGNMVM